MNISKKASPALEAENARMRHQYPRGGYLPVSGCQREAGIALPSCLWQKPIPEGDICYRLQVSAALCFPFNRKAISAAAGRIRTPFLFLAGMNTVPGNRQVSWLPVNLPALPKGFAPSVALAGRCCLTGPGRPAASGYSGGTAADLHRASLLSSSSR